MTVEYLQICYKSSARDVVWFLIGTVDGTESTGRVWRFNIIFSNKFWRSVPVNQKYSFLYHPVYELLNLLFRLIQCMTDNWHTLIRFLLVWVSDVYIEQEGNMDSGNVSVCKLKTSKAMVLRIGRYLARNAAEKKQKLRFIHKFQIELWDFCGNWSQEGLLWRPESMFNESLWRYMRRSALISWRVKRVMYLKVVLRLEEITEYIDGKWGMMYVKPEIDVAVY